MITNIESLKNQMDIVEIISTYLPLKKSGANFSANCPFHAEKTGSFVVSPAKQIFNCFGCGKGGDAITFVKEYRHLEYIEAIEEIARIMHFSLEYKSVKKSDNANEVNHKFLEYCTKNAESIKDEVLKRGFSEDIIKEFKLGYSGEDFEIRNAIYDKENAVKLGLLHDTPNGYKSMFAKRLIIPIFNAGNICVGFSGRALKSQQKPKYINSKESSIYKKRQVLYGFNIAKEYIKAKKEAIIVEGYFDVMSLHNLGYKNSVGVCGTAFGREHIALIKKYDSDIDIILALDNDTAGLEATKRAIYTLLENEIYKSYVLKIESKQKDFNDIMLHDRAALKSMKKIPIIIFLLKDIYKRLNANNSLSIEDRAKIAKEAISVLEKIKDNYIKIEYHKYAIKLFGFDIGNLRLDSKKPVESKSMKYDLTLARILKATFNNPQYKEILTRYTKKEQFRNLADSYINCLNDKLDSTLNHIIFNDIYVLDYKDINEFLNDINSLKTYTQKQDIKEILNDTTLTLKEKIGIIESFGVF